MSIGEPAEKASEVNRGRPGRGSVGLLRAVALIAALAGAAGSFGLMLRVGRRNPSLILLALFTVWVLSPFVALLWANAVSNRRPVSTRAALHSVTLVIAMA